MPVNAPNKDLNWKAPSFHLKNIDNRLLSLENLRGINGTVIAFICNHCPYVKAIANNLSEDAEELKRYSINTIAIMPNDVINYPEDSFDNMKIFANKYNFNFPYLYDETQEIAKAYTAACTPDFFGFDKNLELKYRGRINSSKINSNSIDQIERSLFDAMISIKDTNYAPEKQINSIGCSIKWK